MNYQTLTHVNLRLTTEQNGGNLKEWLAARSMGDLHFTAHSNTSLQLLVTDLPTEEKEELFTQLVQSQFEVESFALTDSHGSPMLIPSEWLKSNSKILTHSDLDTVNVIAFQDEALWVQGQSMSSVAHLNWFLHLGESVANLVEPERIKEAQGLLIRAARSVLNNDILELKEGIELEWKKKAPKAQATFICSVIDKQCSIFASTSYPLWLLGTTLIFHLSDLPVHVRTLYLDCIEEAGWTQAACDLFEQRLAQKQAS